MVQQKPWFLYVVECSDQTLYTGVSPYVLRRLAAHNLGRGALYTTFRRPVRLLAVWSFPNQSVALKAEIAFKRLSRKIKLQFVSDRSSFLDAPFVVLD